MVEATAQQQLEVPALDAGGEGSPARRDESRIWLWLLVALIAHSMFLISFASAPPKRLGAPGGADEAISIDVTSEADLQSLSTVADSESGMPAPPAQPAPPTPQQSPAPPPQTAEPQSPPEKQSAPPQKQAALRPSFEPRTETTDASATPSAEPETTKETEQQPPPKALPSKTPEKSAKPAEPKPQPKPREAKPREQQTAKLDLTSPPMTFPAPMGRGGAGVERPPGITRSGENDAFARAVVRALQRTMPQLSNTYGRVTVRITLDMSGSLVRTEVLRPSNVSGLDQNVVFATKQTSYPFPPRNANSNDLIFIITYIYH